MLNSLNKENIVADNNFNRWLVPPAALLIHLSIGMIYGFSVFWKRLTEVVGQQCADNITFFEYILLNIAMGGNLGGTVDPNFSEDVMEVDFVRIYQKK